MAISLHILTTLQNLPAFVHFLEPSGSCLFCICSQFSIYLLDTLLSVCSIISIYLSIISYLSYLIFGGTGFPHFNYDSGFICLSRFQGGYASCNPISLMRPRKIINFQSVQLLLIVRTGVMTSKLLYEGQN